MMGYWKRVLVLALALPGPVEVHADNLLIITADTLRADRLSSYGYRANKTPAIDRWASEGVRFENAFSEIPLTLPAHSTLLTGTYPFFHGVRDNAGFHLPGERQTLAEVLAGQGYATSAFISAYVLASQFGMAQGFDHFDERFPTPTDGLMSTNSLRRPGAETTSRFLEWLEKRPPGPFFSWLHLYDPHAPYDGGYDREVSRVDEAVARIDATLRRLNLIEDTHILFLSDHGESLGEHAESGHGFFIYDSTLRIPWIFRPARSFKPQVTAVDEQFSLVDVMPTVLQLLRLQSPDEVQGRSAVRAMLGRSERSRPLYAETLLPQLQFGWSPLRSLRNERYKLIDAPRPELYDLRNDSAEERDIFSEEQALGAQMREQLKLFSARYSSSGASQASTSLSPEDAERLGTLGYVALAAPVVDETDRTGADPKDRIEVFEKYQQLLAALHGTPSPSLLARVAEIRRLDPEVKGLDYLEGLAREQGGDLEGGVRGYRRAIEADPGNNLARGNLGRVLLKMGRHADAEPVFQELLTRDGSDFRSRNNLGLLMRLRGAHAESNEQFRQVVQDAPGYAPGWINLGVGQAITGQLSEAEKSLRRALELDASNAAAHFHLGRVLLALGRPDEGRPLLEKAATLDPRFRNPPGAQQ